MTNPTNPSAQQQYKSSQSGRFVVPGWMNLIEGTPDAIEIQLDLDQSFINEIIELILESEPQGIVIRIYVDIWVLTVYFRKGTVFDR